MTTPEPLRLPEQAMAIARNVAGQSAGEGWQMGWKAGYAAARDAVLAELFGTPEPAAEGGLPVDAVRLCETARPSEHERRTREQAAAEILAKAEQYADAPTGPRASFRRGLEAAARHILPKPTPQEIADAIAKGDAVYCNPKEPR